MPRFVLLRHECPPHFKKPSHWDFMLESGDVLRTWELQELPSAWAALLGEVAESATVDAIVNALPLPDHRLVYLDYEGPIGDDRGSVHCCDRGTYEFLQESPETLVAKLRGKWLLSTVCLTCRGSGWDMRTLSK